MNRPARYSSRAVAASVLAGAALTLVPAVLPSNVDLDRFENELAGG